MPAKRQSRAKHATAHVRHRQGTSIVGGEEPRAGRTRKRHQPEKGLEPVNVKTATFHQQFQVPAASNIQSPFLSATLARAGITPQGNDYNINAHNVYGDLNLQDQSCQRITNIYGGRTDDLENLKGSVSFEAQFDSSVQDPDRQCHPGTRQNVLTRLQNWIDNHNSTERICWLYGPAGAGKSAIAQTIAHSNDRPKVAATFFFFRSDVNRNDGNRLFTTLAYQLAFSLPAIRDYISNSLYGRPDLPRAGIETQFNQLIARPFQVFRDDATRQWTPAVDVIINILEQYRALAPLIIIDGIDECTDEKLQQRFLKVIGDAVMDDHFPLRFLIVSRPEVHIEHAIRDFQTPVLDIDLAKLDDANRDIQKYLVDNFARIASKGHLHSKWPGQKIIDDIIYKSSGNFIFASLVIRFVGDPYSYAPTQLDIVLNIKPAKTTSPFELLDQLYLEILKRVPDQDFLKKYFALFTARVAVSNGHDLHKDDAMVMHISKEELHANLSRMRSILKFENGIDVYHKSFLDFLYDETRSGQYYIPEPIGGRRFVELFIDSLIRCISTSMEHHDDHQVLYSESAFRRMINYTPPKFTLPTKEWQEVIRPLLDFQDHLLQMPDFASTSHFLSCYQCVTRFVLVRELLHVGLHHGIFNDEGNQAIVQSVMNVRNRDGLVSSTKANTKKTNGDRLEILLLSLFSRLPGTMENWLPNEEVIKFIKDILRFDCAITATRVGFISDAQKLTDLLDYLINEKEILVRIDQDATRKATLLALEIFARVPVLPVSSLLEGKDGYYVPPCAYVDPDWLGLERLEGREREWLKWERKEWVRRERDWLERERPEQELRERRERERKRESQKLERDVAEWEQREVGEMVEGSKQERREQWEREREQEYQKREQEAAEWEQKDVAAQKQRRVVEREQGEALELKQLLVSPGHQQLEMERLERLDKCHADIRLLFWTLFTNRVLNHHYVVPMKATYETRLSKILRGDMNKQDNSFLIKQWRLMSNPRPTLIQIAFRIAKTIQYFHSMGITLDCTFGPDNIYLDGYLRPKICCLRSPEKSRFPLIPSSFSLNSREGNIFSFGLVVYELFSGDTKLQCNYKLGKTFIAKRLSTPEYAWQLIQRCHAKGIKSQPTIDEVVEVIESWGVEIES